MTINRTNCCGLRELNDLCDYRYNPERALKDFCSSFFHGQQDDEDLAAFILFTGVSKERYGQRFASLIKKNKLGKILETRAKLNPNSGSIIKTWIWDINRPATRAWDNKH